MRNKTYGGGSYFQEIRWRDEDQKAWCNNMHGFVYKNDYLFAKKRTDGATFIPWTVHYFFSIEVC